MKVYFNFDTDKLNDEEVRQRVYELKEVAYQLKKELTLRHVYEHKHAPDEKASS